MFLPKPLTANGSKALGLCYTIQSDKLHVMVAVNFSKKQEKNMHWSTRELLTRGHLLSQVF